MDIEVIDDENEERELESIQGSREELRLDFDNNQHKQKLSFKEILNITEFEEVKGFN